VDLPSEPSGWRSTCTQSAWRLKAPPRVWTEAPHDRQPGSGDRSVESGHQRPDGLLSHRQDLQPGKRSEHSRWGCTKHRREPGSPGLVDHLAERGGRRHPLPPRHGRDGRGRGRPSTRGRDPGGLDGNVPGPAQPIWGSGVGCRRHVDPLPVDSGVSGFPPGSLRIGLFRRGGRRHPRTQPDLLHRTVREERHPPVRRTDLGGPLAPDPALPGPHDHGDAKPGRGRGAGRIPAALGRGCPPGWGPTGRERGPLGDHHPGPGGRPGRHDRARRVPSFHLDGGHRHRWSR